MHTDDQLSFDFGSDVLVELVSGSPAVAERTGRADATLQPSIDTITRFRQRIVATPTCHWFIGAISVPDAYGRVTFQHAGRTRTMSAHRFALLAAGVEVGVGQVGEHGCDETICVRVHPDHVRVATQPANLAHAVAVGRHRGPRPGDIDPRGRVGRALAIRAALSDGYDADRLAEAMAWGTWSITDPLF